MNNTRRFDLVALAMAVGVLGMASTAGAASLVVDWGESSGYVTAAQSWSRALSAFTTGDFDNDNGGTPDDVCRYVPFSMSAVMRNTGGSYSGTNAAFYGGVDLIVYNQTANWSTAGDGGVYNGIGNTNPDTINATTTESNASNKLVRAAFLWVKTDFLAGSGWANVGLDSSSTLTLTTASLSSGLSVRFLVKNAGILYVSNTNLTANATLTLSNPTTETWAEINTNNSDRLYLWTIGSYATRTFGAVEAVGCYATGNTTVGSPKVSVKNFEANAYEAAANAAPVIDQGENVSTNMNEDAGTLNLTNLILTASDPDGNNLTWTNTTTPANGSTVSVSGTGTNPVTWATFTYTPGGNFHGTNSFMVRASDGLGGLDSITVTVVVAAMNDPPTNPVRPNVTGTPSPGQVLTASPGTWDDAADTNFGGTATFTFGYEWQSSATNDGTGISPLGDNDTQYTVQAGDVDKYVRVQVVCTNEGVGTPQYQVVTTNSNWTLIFSANAAPVIDQGGPLTTNMNEDGATLDLSAFGLSASDADGDLLTWTNTTMPTDGTVAVSGSGTNPVFWTLFAYTPNTNFNGTNSFVVEAFDGKSGYASITVTVVVAAINDPPVNTAVPTASGIWQVNNELTASPGTWDDNADTNASYPPPTLTYGYQWQRATNAAGDNPVNIGAGANKCTLTESEAMKYVRVQVTATDTGHGTPASTSATANTDWTYVDRASTNLYVSYAGSDSAPGDGTFANPYATITNAIAKAIPYDTVHVMAGTQTEYNIMVDKVLTIEGEGKDSTIVQANPSRMANTGRRVFDVQTNATIKNMTLRYGYNPPGQSRGLAVRMLYSGLRLRIENCRITQNDYIGGSQTYNGGAVAPDWQTGGSTLLELIGSEITSNASTAAGGIILTYTAGIVSNCTFSGNIAATAGAGLTSRSGSEPVTIYNSTFDNNATTNGGALYSAGAPFSIYNSTFFNNAATNNGGALYITAPLTVFNCTIYSNRAGSGGGAYCGNAPATPFLFNSTIVAGNSATNGPDIYKGLGALSATNCLVGDTGSSGLLSVPGTTNASGSYVGTNGALVVAMLAPLADNGGPTRTCALLPGSLAIDAGLNVMNFPYDQRGPGYGRVKSGKPDMGAFEYFVNSAPVIDQASPLLAAAMDEDGAPTAWAYPTLTATEPDGQSVTWTNQGQPAHGTVVVSGTGTNPVAWTTFTYTPNANWNGTDSFVVVVSDGVLSNTITVNVPVNARNDPPTNGLIPTVSGLHQVGQTLTASDGTWGDNTDQQPGALSLSRQWQRADNDSGLNAANIGTETNTTYDCTAGDTGKYVRVQVTCTDDGEGLPATTNAVASSVWTLVTRANAAPVIDQGPSMDATAMDEDGTPTAWAIPILTAVEPDGDSVTWTNQGQPAHGTVVVSGTGTNPTWTTFTYTPNANWNGTDSFVVVASDGVLEDTITVNVPVNARNDPPTNGAIPTVSGPHQNGQTLTANDGTWGDNTDQQPGNLSYARKWQRATNDMGADTVDIGPTETNVTYGCTVANVSRYVRVQVTCTDDGEGLPATTSTVANSVWTLVTSAAPVIGQTDPLLAAAMDEDGAPTAWAIPTLSATDADGDSLTWTNQGQPAHGTVVVSGTGTTTVVWDTFTYTPTANWNGTDSFVVAVSDGVFTNTITVNVPVRPRNDPPNNTAVPTLSGEFRPGNAVSGTNGTWNDSTDQQPGALSYTYQWQRATNAAGDNAVDIGGAQAASYTLTPADGEKWVTLKVTATDNGEGLPATTNASASSVWTAVANTPSTLYVRNTGSDSTGDGTAGNPYGTITNAIAKAIPYDTVHVMACTQTEYNITVNKILTIEGEGKDSTIVQANTARLGTAGRRVFDVQTNATLENMTLRYGHFSSTARGMAVLVRFPGTRVLIEGCRIAENDFTGGNADYNGAAVGGYWTSAGVSALELVGCEIVSNRSTAVGGILLSDMSGIVSNCTISGNAGLASGGGLRSRASTELVKIYNSTFDNNVSSNSGGAVYLENSPAFIYNSTFFGNAATNSGGALYSGATTAAVFNCTIYSNVALASGGGAFCDNTTVSRYLFNSTIVAGNSAASGPDIQKGSGVLSATNCLVGDNGSSGLLSVSGTTNASGSYVGTNGALVVAMLAPLADNGGPTRTCALLLGSLAIDAGLNAMNFPYDQRGPGYSRVKSGKPDMGAVEYFVNSAPVIDQASPLLATAMDEDGAPTAWAIPTLTATEPDGQSVTWTNQGQPAHGTVVVSGTGTNPVAWTTFTYTPDAHWNGTDSFVVVASDGVSSNTITVNVPVSPRNDPPGHTAIPTVSGTHQVGQTLTANDGTWNDSTDVTPGNLTYTRKWQRADDGAGSGAADIGATATNVTYECTASDTGKYVRVQVTCTDDGEGFPATTSAVASSVWTLVTRVNVAPQIDQGPSVEATAMDEDGTPTAWAIPTLTAVDADGDSLTWTNQVQPAHGTVVVNGAGTNPVGFTTFAYTPDANWNGTDSFVVVVSDGALTDTITVQVPVTPRNDAPVNTAAPGVSGTFQVGQELTRTAGTWNDTLDTDVSGGSALTLSYQWQRADDGAGLNTVNLLDETNATYTLVSDDTGKYVRVQETCADNGVGLPASTSATASSAWQQVQQAPETFTAVTNGRFDASDADTWGHGLGVYPNLSGDVANIPAWTVTATNLAEVGDGITVNLSGTGMLELNKPVSNGSEVVHSGATVNVHTGATFKLNDNWVRVRCTTTLNGGELALKGAGSNPESRYEGGVLNVLSDSFVGPASFGAYMGDIDCKVTGSGKLTLTNNPVEGTATFSSTLSTWNGDWDVAAGTLNIASAATVPQELRIAAGAKVLSVNQTCPGTITGNGTYSLYRNSTLTIEGTVSPGDAGVNGGVGMLAVTNHGSTAAQNSPRVSFAAGSTYKVDIQGTAPVQYDRMTVTPSSDYAGTGRVNIVSGAILDITLWTPTGGVDLDATIIDLPSGMSGAFTGQFSSTNWHNTIRWMNLAVTVVDNDLHVTGSTPRSGTIFAFH